MSPQIGSLHEHPHPVKSTSTSLKPPAPRGRLSESEIAALNKPSPYFADGPGIPRESIPAMLGLLSESTARVNDALADLEVLLSPFLCPDSPGAPVEIEPTFVGSPVGEAVSRAIRDQDNLVVRIQHLKSRLAY